MSDPNDHEPSSSESSLGKTDQKEKELEAREEAAVETILRDQLQPLADLELKRADSFRQRASWLLGFSGVILGLGGSQADELLKDSHELGSFGHWFAPIALGLAFLAVGLAAFWSLRVLFRGRKKGPREFDKSEVEKALEPKYLKEGRAYNQQRIAKVLKQGILDRRKLNVENNTSLRYAFVALLVAVVLFIAQAGVLLENTVEDQTCPRLREQGPLTALDHPHSAPAGIRSFATTLVEIKRPPCPDTEPVPE